jgi:hypothetical protein
MDKERHEYRMINVMSMIETLHMLYDKGVDYVDISGEQGNENDEITFSFCKSYMDEEYKHTFETGFIQEENEEVISKPKPNEEFKTFKLTDSDIDDLIL